MPSVLSFKIVLETCDFRLKLVNGPILILDQSVHHGYGLVHLDMALLVGSYCI